MAVQLGRVSRTVVLLPGIVCAGCVAVGALVPLPGGGWVTALRLGWAAIGLVILLVGVLMYRASQPAIWADDAGLHWAGRKARADLAWSEIESVRVVRLSKSEADAGLEIVVKPGAAFLESTEGKWWSMTAAHARLRKDSWAVPERGVVISDGNWVWDPEEARAWVVERIRRQEA